MRYEPRCQHKNGYDCEICDKSYKDYKLNYGNQKEKYDDKAFLNEPCWHTHTEEEIKEIKARRRAIKHWKSEFESYSEAVSARRKERGPLTCVIQHWEVDGLDPEWYKD